MATITTKRVQSPASGTPTKRVGAAASGSPTKRFAYSDFIQGVQRYSWGNTWNNSWGDTWRFIANSQDQIPSGTPTKRVPVNPT